MIVKELHGDIWDTECEVITIPVNCVGVMGSGLAKQARLRCPKLYSIYKHLHDQYQLSIKRPNLVRDHVADRLFLLFPTKRHWRDPSQLHWVEHNIQWIADEAQRGRDLAGVKSIAIPPVGCGLGQLPYESVYILLHQLLEPIELEVHLYLPPNFKPFKVKPKPQLEGE